MKTLFFLLLLSPSIWASLSEKQMEILHASTLFNYHPMMMKNNFSLYEQRVKESYKVCLQKKNSPYYKEVYSIICESNKEEFDSLDEARKHFAE